MLLVSEPSRYPYLAWLRIVRSGVSRNSPNFTWTQINPKRKSIAAGVVHAMSVLLG
jgi:hypothetical protein